MNLRFFLSPALALLAAAASAAGRLDFDKTGFRIDGERRFLISGEIHYFRVPRAEWADRLRRLKAVGGTCVATYVPWGLHEPTEGKVLFGDVPERDFAGFLAEVEKAGLMAIVRPGPYQYSELMFDGLPRWLVERYPAIHTKKKDGSRLRTGSVDYDDPVFLEKTRRYFREFAKVVRPHLAINGGCVQMVQLDNELTGIHVWFGAPADEAYFRRSAAYLDTLRGFLAAEGVPGPYCHNAGGTTMTANCVPAAERLGTRDFLLGYDSYYNLCDVRLPESPGHDYLLNTLFACDTLRSLGYPPVGFEIQTGSPGDCPPVLEKDLLASLMVNLAAGARGINYYIFAGGPNPAGMGTMADVYDYAAPIAADGTPRRTYEALKAFGRFVQDNPRLILAERLFSVRFAYEWQHFAGCAAIDEAFFRHGLRYSLMQSAYQPGYLALTGPIAGPEPVVLSGITSMSAAMQRHLADYVLGGGGLLVAPDFPRVDLEGKPCTVLAAAVKAPLSEECRVDTVVEPLMRSGERRLYNMTPVRVFPELPPAARACLTDAGGGRIYGCSWAAGKGRVVQVGATWQAVGFAQSDFAAGIVRELGARPLGKSSQRNLFHVDYRLEDGRTGVFALNLRASPVSAEITLPDGEELMFDLGAMEVGYKESALKEPGGNIGKTDPCHFR